MVEICRGIMQTKKENKKRQLKIPKPLLLCRIAEKEVEQSKWIYLTKLEFEKDGTILKIYKMLH